jgi:hypothetical protein
VDPFQVYLLQLKTFPRLTKLSNFGSWRLIDLLESLIPHSMLQRLSPYLWTSLPKRLQALISARPITLAVHSHTSSFLVYTLHSCLNVTMSSIVNRTKFINHEMPFPIVQALELNGANVECFGIYVPSTNSTIVSRLLPNLPLASQLIKSIVRDYAVGVRCLEWISLWIYTHGMVRNTT